ncbi:MAG TPA: endo-1,3-alpha-glucanase family glycosylhydrolase [Armatimonadota bacterium]|jgi:hypothetical protein
MRYLGLLAPLLLLLALLPVRAQVTPPPPRIVWAHYMHCFILGGIEPNFQPPAAADVENFPAWPPTEQTMRPWWSARLAPLAKAGLEGVRTDFDLAQQAGLDALGLLISQSHLPNSQYASAMRRAAQVAATHQVKLIPDLWGWTLQDTPEKMTLYGQHVKALMDQYPDGFLKYQGKYVISLGAPLGYGRAVAQAKGTYFTEWEVARHFFDPWGGPDGFYRILDATWDVSDLEGGWGENSDAFYQWDAAAGWGDPQNRAVADAAVKYGKAICWPINSTYYGGRQACESMAEDLGITRLSDQWRRAISLGAPWAVVQTWNDFSEDHCITETNYRGQTLMNLTRYYADWFRAGTPPPIVQEQVFLFHHRQLVHAQLSAATIRAHNDQYHLCPTSDYLNVVTLLQTPGQVRLRIGETSWEVAAPAGWHEWLVYVPSDRTEAGPLREAYNRGASSYPQSTAWRTVTVAPAIPPGRPRAGIVRGGQVAGTVVSRTDLAGEAPWQDLCMVGTMGEVRPAADR